MPTDTLARAIAAKIPATPPGPAAWVTTATLPAITRAAAVASDGTNVIVAAGSNNNGDAVVTARYVTPGGSIVTMPNVPVSAIYCAAAFYAGRFYVIGGTSGGAPTNAVQAFTPSATTLGSGTWAQAAVLPAARAYTSAAVLGNYLYVAGGQSGSQGTNTGTATLYRFDGTSWTTLAAMPSGRSGGALVGVGTKLYHLGGQDTSGTSTATVYVFDTTTGTWSTGAPLPAASYENSAVLAAGLIYLYGYSASTFKVITYDPATGASTTTPTLVASHADYANLAVAGSVVSLVSGASTAIVESLDAGAIADTAVSGWSTLGTLPANRYAAACTYDGTNIIISGGYTPASSTPDNLAYTITPAGVVTQTSTQPQQRAATAFAFANGRHYVFSGAAAANGSPLNNFQYYTPGGTNDAAGVWSNTFSTVPVPVLYGSAAAIGTLIYIAGGQTGTALSTASATFMRYDTAAATWTNLTATAPLPAARTQGSLVAIGSKLYYLGGFDSSGNGSGVIYVYDTSTGAWSTLSTTGTGISGPGPAVAIGSVIWQANNTAIRGFDVTTGALISPPNVTAHGTQAALAAIGNLVLFISGQSTANIDSLDTSTAGTTAFGRRIKLLQQYLAGTDVAAFAVAKRLPLIPPTGGATPAWKTLAALPATRYNAATTTDGTNVIVTHGYTTAVVNSGVTITPGGVVTALSTASSGNARQNAASVFCNGRHWVIGGLTSSNAVTNLVDAYTPGGANGASGTWAAGTAIPFASRQNMAAAAIGNVIYVAGGMTNTAISSAGTFFAKFDTSTNTWTDLTSTAPLPAQRANASMVAWNGKLYYLGGTSSGNIVQPTVYIYDPTAGTWSTGPSMFEEMDYGSATVLNGVAYVSGRYFPSGTSGTEAYGVQTYNLATGAGAMLSPQNTQHYCNGSATIGSVIYLVSGQLTANVDVLDPVSGPDYIANVKRLRVMLAA